MNAFKYFLIIFNIILFLIFSCNYQLHNPFTESLDSSSKDNSTTSDVGWTIKKDEPAPLNNDYPKGIGVDGNDNIYVVGFKENATDDWRILKFSSYGIEDTTNWNIEVDWHSDDDCAQAVAVDSNNYVYVAGWCTDSGDTNWGLKKYDANGTLQWTKEWGYLGSVNDEAQGMAIDGNNNIYVVGCVVDTDFDWYIKKYDTAGNEDLVNWEKRFDSGNGNDTAIAVAIDSSNNVYVAGRVTNGSGNNDWMIKKYNSSGTEIISGSWNVPFNGAGDGGDRISSITIDSNNNIIVTGYVTQGGGDIDWCIKKYDFAGNEYMSWDIYVNQGIDDVPWAITSDSNNNVFVGGRLLISDDEWAVEKYDPSGNWIPAFEDIIINTGSDWCRALVCDSQNNIYGAGAMKTSGNNDWFIKKYVQ